MSTLSETRVIIESTLVGISERIGVAVFLSVLYFLGVFYNELAVILGIAFFLAEILVRASEIGLEKEVAAIKRDRVIVAIARKYASKHSTILLPIIIFMYIITVYASLKGTTTLAIISTMTGLTLILWWRGLASAIAVRAGLAKQVFRSGVAVPAIGILLLLLSKNTSLQWITLLIFTSYISSGAILYASMKVVGLVSRRYGGRILFPKPDIPSILSGLKFIAIPVLAIVTHTGLLLIAAIIFDASMRLSLLLGVKWKYSRLLGFLALFPGIVAIDLYAIGYGLILGFIGLFGYGFQSSLRCILCI